MASAFPYLIWFGNAPVVNAGHTGTRPTNAEAQQLLGTGGSGPDELDALRVEGTNIYTGTSPPSFRPTYMPGANSVFIYPSFDGPGNANTVMTGFFSATFRVRFIDQDGNDVVESKQGVVMQMGNGDLFFRPSVQSIDDWDNIQAIITMEVTAIAPVAQNTWPATIGFHPGILDVPIIPCFVRGTLIATEGGERPVESLQPGDLVLTRDNGPQPLRWIGRSAVPATKLDLLPPLRPIRIRAGALAPAVPSRDLLVSPQHRILVRSKIAQRMFGAEEVLVAAKHLLAVDGIEVARDLAEVEYFHLLLDGHQILTADGAGAESLYLGAEARKALGPAAWAEIRALFPDLAEYGAEDGAAPPRARPFVGGRQGRSLSQRQQKHGQPLARVG